MGADLSRIRSNPLLDFAGVELKQGGVVLDADVNELVAVVDRRLRALASDVLGRSTVSQTTPAAFKLSVVAGALMIAKGRLYVDGLLAENHGAVSDDAAQQVFDPLLAEPAYADAIDYAAQPYLPYPPALPTSGRHLVYLDVWQRELTHLERPELVEIAVGVETSSRLQTVWQVRVLGDDAGNATCGSDDEDFAGWVALTSASTGRLTTGTFTPPPSTDPCELPPSGDYQGLENQTYRVEIHDPGQPGGAATFKWSRENASVGSRVASVISATELQLQTLGRDDVLRFNTGDWVEIVDDRREFSQAAGEMRRITVDEAAQRIAFTPALPAAMLPGAFPDDVFPAQRNLRVRRWDQKGKVLRAVTDTPVFQNLDDAGSTGVIKVPAAGTTLMLENGVTVSFASTGAKGFRAGDHWVFAARTADASIEKLVSAPPRGIHHHYARLGIWTVGAGDPSDCRTPWPPRGEGHDCSCSECVTPESHASGALTIQAAVDRVRETGGTVCLAIGQYALQEPVRLNNARSLRIRGQGAGTVIVTPGAAFAITTGIAIAIEDLTVLSLGNATAIAVRTAVGLSLQRLLIAVLGDDKSGGVAIALGGVLIGATVRDNTILAPVAISSSDPSAGSGTGTNQPPPPVLATALLRVEDNLLWCDRIGIVLAGRVFHLMATRLGGNELVGCRQAGIAALGFGAPGSSMHIDDNNATVSGPAIIAGVDGLWIERNKLTAAAQRSNRVPDGAAITLRAGLDPTGSDQCQVLANQISGFTGAGLLIESPVRQLIVKLNIIERCGNGIVSTDEAESGEISIENNHISDIGTGEAQTDFVVGIGVTRAGAASIVGNTVRRVGLQATLAIVKAGIAAVSVERLRASGNQVLGVAPSGEYAGRGVGLMLLAPFSQAQIANNEIDRDETPSDATTKASWNALLIDQPGENRFVARQGRYAAVRVDAQRTMVFGARRPYVVATAAIDVAGAAAVRGASVSVLGNTLAGRSGDPAVDVSASADCLFSDNRCELRGDNGRVAVSLAARTGIVNANRVVGGEVSVLLQIDPKLITVLGNITRGPIVTGGASSSSWQGLGGPWDTLNIRG